jgi:hypothetical protein
MLAEPDPTAGPADAPPPARDETSAVPSQPREPAGAGAAAAAPVPAAAVPAAPVPAATPLPLADADPVRAEVVESARRLVGVRNSFDDRSFLGHVLRVNALLPAGAAAATYGTDAHLRFARSSGTTVAVESARPGDVVLFPCPGGCGASAVDGVGAGVVERVADRRVEFIAYVNGLVRRCWTGAGRDPGPGYLEVAKVLAVTSLAR